ncbi:MAG TPA: hypothetical protein VM940_03805 [Chthoniobacterales bacterium]|jgi:opacity protein-like surface antigen|nr:hypothetical protein [Chthoniobacterales bacterium]
MKYSRRLPILAAMLLLLLAGWSQAQDAVKNPVAQEKSETVSLDLFELKSSYVFESDLHRAGSFGEQYAIQNAFSYAHRFFLSGHLYLRLGVAYDRFDFGTSAAPVPDQLQSVAAVIGVDYMHNNDIGAFIQIKPGFYTVNDFDYAAFDAPITLGRIFVLQPDRLYFFTGLNAAFLRGRWPVIPLAGLIWMPNETWKVMAMLPEPRVIYSPSERVQFWAGGELVGGSFRTDRNAAIVPTRLNGAQVDYSEYRVGGGFVYTPCDNVSIDLGGGYAIQRRFDFHRADIVYKTDGAPYLRFAVKASF